VSALGQILGKGNVTYHIAVAESLDSVAAAIFAEQIAFWQSRSDDGWAFRTSEEIREYTALTRRVQDTARKHLKDTGLLEERKEGMPQRLYFRLDIEALGRLIEKSVECAPNRQTDAPNRQTDAPNGQTLCTESPNRSIEGEEREEREPLKGGAKNAPKKNGQVKRKGNPYVTYLVELYNEANNAGKRPQPLDQRKRGEYGRLANQYSVDGYNDDEIHAALRWMVKRACGEIEGEKGKSWVNISTAMDAVAEGGGSGSGDSEEMKKRKEEFNQRRKEMYA
jgi:hypothetical protein